MSLRTIARRYAGALFDVAAKNQTLDRAERDLGAFSALLSAHPELQRVLETPVIPPAKKRAILDELIARSGGLDGGVMRLLRMLADRDRLNLLSSITAAFEDRLRQERGVLQAEIVTAVPFPDAQRESLTAALRQATGSDLLLTETVDPAIIGGVVARVGSVVFDGSITRQIERLKQRLLEEV